MPESKTASGRFGQRSGQSKASFGQSSKESPAFRSSASKVNRPAFRNVNGVSTSDLDFWLRLSSTDPRDIGRYNPTTDSFHSLNDNQKRTVAWLMQGAEDARVQMPRRTLIAVYAGGSLHRDGADALQVVITRHIHDDLQRGARSLCHATRLHTATRAQVSHFVIQAARLITPYGYAFDHFALLRELQLYGPTTKARWQQMFQREYALLNDLSPSDPARASP